MCSPSMAAMFSSVPYLPPQEVKHRLVVHHFPRSNQHLEKDACFATIHYIVGMGAHIRSVLGQHEGGIWVSGTHTQIGHALLAATLSPAILCSHFLNPSVALFMVLREFLVLLVGE